MIVRNVPQISFFAAPVFLISKEATTIVTRGEVHRITTNETFEFALKDLHKHIKLFGFMAGYKEQTVIKVLNARLTAPFTLEIDFSDHTQGAFDANAYLATRSGPLLDKLRGPAYFQRFFIDAGAMCWPNGLELSPAKIHEQSVIQLTA